VAEGRWYSPEDILREAVSYERSVTLMEPRDRATAWHAHETCRCCGSCLLYGRRSPGCPGVLEPRQVVLSPQGFGPARNIVAFTGGDLTCCPDFYGQCSTLIKEGTGLWVLIETNGWGLTPQNLDYLAQCGVDGFWLDIKAFDPSKHKWLTGCPNELILSLPEEILKKGFVLEVLSLYIPGVVETDQLEEIARRLCSVDPEIPFTILAFFPEHLMRDFRTPTAEEMALAYKAAKDAGLKNVRLGNLGVFLRDKSQLEWLQGEVDPGAL
jgi:pyruvate-formate lyase-activating enzyme